MSASAEVTTSASSQEAPLTLLEAPPRPLGLRDQVALWGNLGITLTIPVAGWRSLWNASISPLSPGRCSDKEYSTHGVRWRLTLGWRQDPCIDRAPCCGSSRSR